MARSRRSATRSVGPQSPPKSRQPAPQQSSPQTRRSIRSASKETDNQRATLSKPVRKLVAVEEEKTADSDSAPDADRRRREDSSDSADEDDFNSSEESEDHEDDLDLELVVENLPTLFQDALKIVSLSSSSRPHSSLEELDLEVPGTARRFKHYYRRLQTTLQAYRHDDGFIPVTNIIQKVTDSASKSRLNRGTSAILYMANLAIVLSDLIWQRDESKLELFANRFPGSDHALERNGTFYPSFSDSSASFLDGALVRVAIELRTQYFLSILNNVSNSQTLNVGNLLQQAFFDEDGNPLGFESYTVKVLSDVADLYNVRVKEISKLLPKKHRDPAYSAKLSMKYPINSFNDLLLQWVLSRKQLLQSTVNDYGSLDDLVENLRGLMRDATTQQVATPKTKQILGNSSSAKAEDSRAADRTSSASMSKRMQQLKRLRALRDTAGSEENSETGSVSEHGSKQEIPGSPILGDTGIGGQVENVRMTDESGEPSVPSGTQGSVAPSQKTAMILEVARRQATQSNKENINIADSGRRFVDRQKGAKRIEWDDRTDDRNVKRTHDPFSLDEDTEDGFEIDTRKHKRARIEREVRSKRPAQMREVDDDDDEQAQVDIQLRSEDLRHNLSSPPRPATQPQSSRSPLQIRPSNTARAPPSSAPANVIPRSSAPRGRTPTPTSSAIQAQEIDRVNREAKLNVGRFRAVTSVTTGVGPQPQVRRAWASAEIERLMEMVALHGTAWALILQEDQKHPDGPELQGRGQVALKDKARNIKMDYLKACQPLPEGFAGVSIKASDMAKLDELSIPHQGGPGGRGAQAPT